MENLETTNQNVSLQINKLQEIVASAPAVLEQNKQSKAKCIEAGSKLIELASKGMNDVYDAQLDSYIKKANTTIKAMNERRKPFSQIVDAVKKEFTTIEAELKPVIDKAQSLRNNYVTQKMKEKQEAERQAALKIAAEKELAECRSEYELKVLCCISNCTTQSENTIIDKFNKCTLDNFEATRESIINFPVSFDSLYSLPIANAENLKTTYLTTEQRNALIAEVSSVDYSYKKAEYKTQIEAIKKIYIDKLPSKKQELEALAKADAAERARIEEESKQRAKEEAERLKAEQDERNKKYEAETAAKAAGAVAAAIVDANGVTTETPKVKEGFKITLKSNAAYLLLAQFWFEKEGKTLTAEKFEKMTFGRIVKFCEAYAFKNNEQITSPYISYEPIYKAK